MAKQRYVNPWGRQLSNESLDESIQHHFRAQELLPPPDFEALWRDAQTKAQAPRLHRRARWRPVAVAAGVLLVAAILVNAILENKNSVPRLADTERQALFNELIATTRWQAPSDFLLEAPDSLHVWDMPQFDWLQVTNSEES